MGVGSPDYRCRWVLDRLPLLAGGDLTGADRRKVERHLIACAGCRRRERSLTGALGVLQAASALSPVGPASEPPSLWPALARQIREARHEPASWLDGLARLVRPSARFRPALVLASGLLMAGLTAAGVETWVRWRVDSATALIVDAALPVEFDDFDPGFIPAPVAAPVPEPPLPGQSVVSNEPPAPSADRNPSRFDYDLDHGTPMGPDGLDIKASY